MNAKTDDTLISLKMLSAMEREMHERATKVGAHILSVHALMVAGVTENAAELIEEQRKEISDLKAQLANVTSASDNKGRAVRLANMDACIYVIVGENPDLFLLRRLTEDRAFEVHKSEVTFIS
ncbi:TPA: hypothetical protein NU484_001697 [Escherichia coli]|uniref:hypothetical protein n=1 Tax=Escherichia coli TaxID=562 RepID=UPI000BE195DA|nr:hypothetical protein [Escherichia coli]EFN5365198.1 hypothetical protein [Escherichia coli]EIM2944381.1 hypothetical protein [Escherichia coli]MED8008451.1 hypothetical protein [Escherichia coli]MED8031552.1 hypothetical protein [Escherichia coli]MED8038568.1 hypothetical protein [Escherichia coli]